MTDTNLSNINPKLPCLRAFTFTRAQQRKMSCSTSSKSTYSSSTPSSILSKSVSSVPILLQLCIHSDEIKAYQTMKLLFSPRYRYSSNVCDEFGCNLLMYTLRYQRFHLFNYLLNEISLDLNLRSKDRQGNTILHYAVIYGKDNTEIMEDLIEKFNKFGIDIDERNEFGFTPLLLAVFCGRYDIALLLLTETDASPFVRDRIQCKSMLDYVEIDVKHRELNKTLHSSRQSSHSPLLSRESTRLRVRLHQTLPPRPTTPYHLIQNHPNKNFFEHILPQVEHDRSGTIRSSILQMFNMEYSSSDLIRLVNYINERYPQIKSPKRHSQTRSHDIITTTKLDLQRENTKTDIHRIFNLFDPDLRPKAELVTKVSTPQPSPPQIARQPIGFKRIGTKISLLAALSRAPIPTKPNGLITTSATK